jgi:hypothetical protein
MLEVSHASPQARVRQAQLHIRSRETIESLDSVGIT